MKDSLEIKKESRGQIVILNLDGRVDAYWSGVLDEAIGNEIRAGNYRVYLNFSKVDYLSSAGIRILVKNFKELKKVSGEFFVTSLSADVMQVLKLVGMDVLIGEEPGNGEPENLNGNNIELGETSYSVETLSSEVEMKLELSGNPMAFDQTVGESNFTKVYLDEPKYGLGLGAISSEASDALKRMGEFIALGNAVAYLPTDSSNAPDYMLKSGKLVPEIQSLYGLFFNEGFDKLIYFEHKKDGHTLPFSKLIENIKHITKYKRFAMVSIAETTGLVGASLRKAPASLAGNKTFDFPEVRENMHFTIEPEHTRQLAVITCVVSSNDDGRLKPFCRPFHKNFKTIGHVHAAVFSFYPIKKTNISLSDTIRNSFENERLLDILHLLNDDREAIGIGESQFLNGTCWIGEIKQ